MPGEGSEPQEEEALLCSRLAVLAETLRVLHHRGISRRSHSLSVVIPWKMPGEGSEPSISA